MPSGRKYPPKNEDGKGFRPTRRPPTAAVSAMPDLDFGGAKQLGDGGTSGADRGCRGKNLALTATSARRSDRVAGQAGDEVVGHDAGHLVRVVQVDVDGANLSPERDANREHEGHEGEGTKDAG